MTEFVRNLTASAISSLFFRCLQEHEASYHDGRCLYPYNAAKCEQTMRTCALAQIQLGCPYDPDERVIPIAICPSAEAKE